MIYRKGHWKQKKSIFFGTVKRKILRSKRGKDVKDKGVSTYAVNQHSTNIGCMIYCQWLLWFLTRLPFNNPIKICFLNKKYAVSIQPRKTKIENRLFLIQNPDTIGVKNQLPIIFGPVLVYNKMP